MTIQNTYYFSSYNYYAYCIHMYMQITIIVFFLSDFVLKNKKIFLIKKSELQTIKSPSTNLRLNFI